jgi:hypothetical protein
MIVMPQRKLPTTVYTLLIKEPNSPLEVLCSKEGCRAIISPYDKLIYIQGGRSTEAFKKLEVYDPSKNQFTLLNNDCPCGLYNHSVVAYRDQLVFYGGQSTVPGMAQSFTLREMYTYEIPTNQWS